MRTINIGIIGTGNIVCKQHLPALAGLPDVKILAMADLREDIANGIACQHGAEHVFTDYKKLLEMDEIEAVQISTPNDQHMQCTLDAFAAGKHVLVEKPIARNASEAAKMIEAGRKAGKKLMVAQCVRFEAGNQYLKRMIDAGELGEIYFGRAWALRRRGVPSWGVFTDKEKQGGGPLIDVGVHIIDLTLFLMGHPKPVTASGQAFTKMGNVAGHVPGAWGQWDHTKYTVEDYAAGFVRFDDGRSIIVESSFIANIGEDRFNSSLLGTEGGAETNPLRVFGEGNGVTYDMSPVHIAKINSYQAEFRGFYDSIINDTEPPVTGEQALNVMKILDGIYKSSELGKEVAIH